MIVIITLTKVRCSLDSVQNHLYRREEAKQWFGQPILWVLWLLCPHICYSIPKLRRRYTLWKQWRHGKTLPLRIFVHCSFPMPFHHMKRDKWKGSLILMYFFSKMFGCLIRNLLAHSFLTLYQLYGIVKKLTTVLLPKEIHLEMKWISVSNICTWEKLKNWREKIISEG